MLSIQINLLNFVEYNLRFLWGLCWLDYVVWRIRVVFFDNFKYLLLVVDCMGGIEHLLLSVDNFSLSYAIQSCMLWCIYNSSAYSFDSVPHVLRWQYMMDIVLYVLGTPVTLCCHTVMLLYVEQCVFIVQKIHVSRCY